MFPISKLDSDDLVRNIYDYGASESIKAVIHVLPAWLQVDGVASPFSSSFNFLTSTLLAPENLFMARIFLTESYDEDGNPMMRISPDALLHAATGSLEELDRIVGQGADPRAYELFTEYTGLHYAAKAGLEQRASAPRRPLRRYEIIFEAGARQVGSDHSWMSRWITQITSSWIDTIFLLVIRGQD
ncbi:hypothetical protein AcW2_005748 [Taiwanofungus camphoratus]|nr:hypothetical protein AcW2_005748 [Antrodia cinnamomea]